MEVKKNNDNNLNIKSLMDKLSKSNDIQTYKNKIFEFIENNNNRLLVSIKNDKKTYLLLTRTYYTNEFDKIEKIINNEDLLNKNTTLTKDVYLKLLSYLNLLLNFEDFYVSKTDYFRSLQLQSKIISIIKKFLINELG
jgi:hypothetical protein